MDDLEYCQLLEDEVEEYLEANKKAALTEAKEIQKARDKAYSTGRAPLKDEKTPYNP